jgi:transposase-like protein
MAKRPATENGPHTDGAFFEHIVKYSTDAACREYLEKRLWPNGPVCPHCKGTKYYKLNDKRPGVYKCAACRKKFTVTIGTVFEDTHIPLRKWFRAIYLMMCSKKSISAHQLSRMLGISYESCWFMCHRIRAMFRIRDERGKKPKKSLRGIVEADETYVGGKPRPGNPAGKSGRGAPKKTPVFGIVQRGGKVVLTPVPNVKKDTLHNLIADHVYNRSKLFTDDYTSYIGLKKRYDHRKVIHSKKEYARWDKDGTNVHTNTIEGVFSLVKRAIIGTYHNVSPGKLSLYCDEWAKRYCHKDIKDAPRFERALDDATGRLTWYFKIGGIMKGCIPVKCEDGKVNAP